MVTDASYIATNLVKGCWIRHSTMIPDMCKISCGEERRGDDLFCKSYYYPFYLWDHHSLVRDVHVLLIAISEVVYRMLTTTSL